MPVHDSTWTYYGPKAKAPMCMQVWVSTVVKPGGVEGERG